MQMMPLKAWPNTALGCNHQSICIPQLQPLCSAAPVPNVLYPGGTKARISPVQWSKPYSILAPLRIRTRAAEFKIISSDHYTTTAHLGGICQTMPLKMWLNTYSSRLLSSIYLHAPVYKAFMFSGFATDIATFYPEEVMARLCPVQSIEPLKKLAPLETWTRDLRVHILE